MSRAVVPSPKDSGEAVKAALIQRVPEIEPAAERDAWHDVRTTDVLAPTDTLPFGSICVVEPGTPVEIKAAQARLASGQRGRFYLRQRQHERLCAAGGVYAVVVYAPRPGHLHLARRLVSASIVDEVVPSWIHPDGRQTYAQLAWSRLIRIESVEGAGRDGT